MQKERFVHVTDAETLAAIELNDFHSPIPAAEAADGAWVYDWSLQQFRLWCLQQELGNEATLHLSRELC